MNNNAIQGWSVRVIKPDFRSVSSDSSNGNTHCRAFSFLGIACLFSKLCGRSVRSCHIKQNNLDTALTLSIRIQLYWTNGQEKAGKGEQWLSKQQLHLFNTFNSVTEQHLYSACCGLNRCLGSGLGLVVDMRCMKCDIQSNITTANIL